MPLRNWSIRLGAKDPRDGGPEKRLNDNRSTTARENDLARIRRPINDSLGPNFEVQKCACGCGCGKHVRFKRLIERCIMYIKDAPGDDRVVTAALSMVHGRSMCLRCYSTHSWGRPLRDKFVEHIKEALGVLQQRDKPTSQAVAAKLEGEPPRYQSLTYEQFRKYLRFPDTDEVWSKCQGLLVGTIYCCEAIEDISCSRIMGFFELYMDILTGGVDIRGHLYRACRSLVCRECIWQSGSKDMINRYVKYREACIANMTNPDWLKFHSKEQISHQAVEAQPDGSDALAEMDPSSENCRMLVELRKRLQQGENPVFIRSFFKLSEELNLSLCAEASGDDPRAPVEYNYGGGAGEP